MTGTPTRGSLVVAVALLLVALAFGVSGCGGDSSSRTGDQREFPSEGQPGDATVSATETESEDAEASEDAEEDPPPDPAASPDIAVWLQGTWTVAHTLTAVEPETMREAADQPSATWTCSVNGDQMTVDAGEHVYEGTLTVEGEAWTYEGTSTYVDEDGTTWTSDVIVDGLRENEDLFSADMAGEISSDTGGTLYIATWNQVGARVR